MRTITRSCVLFLWMQAMMTFVKSQDCTLEAFVNGPLYDSNFDIIGLDDSYPAGKQVRVSCNVGYTGFFKLICVEGKWQPRGTKCQPKSCGHPGDTAFADFNLEIGDDFVFGSKVVYRCQTGYQMVSRTNHRHCMGGGWDGVVPICEAKQCPALHMGNNVQVTGDVEEATFGNVVRFSCKLSNHVLIGPQEIYCNEQGEWSDEKPKCEEIKCARPVIQNGDVQGDTTVYKEDEVLRYQCNPGYKIAVLGETRCTKHGLRPQWSPTPACELITCKLSQLRQPSETSYEPDDKFIFEPGNRVKVTCGANYWISDHQQTSAYTKCKKDGEWTIYPVCQVFTCFTQDSRERTWNSHWGAIKIGDTLGYTCKTGYKSTDGYRWARCTRAGWSPDPQCQVMTCDRKDFLNANIVSSQDTYVYGNQVHYVCKPGYQGEFSLFCGEHNMWKGTNDCRAKSCRKLNINNATIKHDKPSFRHGEKVQYVCNHVGGKRFTVVCESGVWTGIEKCTVSTDCAEAEIPHGFATYNDTTYYYACDEGYKPVTKGWWGQAKCVGGVWSGLKQCIEERHCEVPVIPNSDMTHQHKYYEEGQRLQIACSAGYRAEVHDLECVKGKWHSTDIPMQSICALITKQCSPPPKVDNAVIGTSYQKEYLSDSEVTYQCRQGHEIQGEATLTCKDGKWDERTIECKPISLPQ